MPKIAESAADVQRQLIRFGQRFHLPGFDLEIDGDPGPATQAVVKKAKAALGYREKYQTGVIDLAFRKRLAQPLGYPGLTPAQRVRGLQWRRKYREAARRPLRERAFAVAEGLVGVMEHGGNNQGPIVSKIIRAVGGYVGSPWCGYFVAYCYMLAGRPIDNISVWGYVPWLLRIRGARATSTPRRGDLVQYGFGHTGLFDKWAADGGGWFYAIEGNTGPSGAVSDSSTGGDGVYRKRRHASQVNRFITISE